MGFQEEYRADYQAEVLPSLETTEGYRDFYPVTLFVKGKPRAILRLPLRSFPDGQEAIALLMTTQLNLETLDQLSAILAENISDLKPNVIIGIPSLGLPLAERVATKLGHENWVPLTTSKKFWQDEALGQAVTSVTSVTPKMLYLDPYLISRLGEGKPFVLVDDVACTGGSISGAYKLMTDGVNNWSKQNLGREIVDPKQVYICTVLSEGNDWQRALDQVGFDWQERFITAGHIPMFKKSNSGLWLPKEET